MTLVTAIPLQVYFLIAFGAVCALLGDTAMRSWRSPERVADPSWMWPRPAPIRSEVIIGPRLPSGSLTMSPIVAVARRAAAVKVPAEAFGSFFVPGPTFLDDNPELDVEAMRESFRSGTYAKRGRAEMVREEWVTLPRDKWVTEPVSAIEEHRGATEGWSPLQEAEAVERTALPFDDLEDWWAARLRAFDRAMTRIDSAERTASGRRIDVVRGYGRSTEDEFDAFEQASMRLHAYRMLSMDTREFTRRQSMQLEALLAA